MTTGALQQQDRAVSPSRLPNWVIAAGFGAMALPTFYTLANGAWSREDGAHAPIVVATGAWLLWRERAQLRAAARPGNLFVGLGLLIVSLAAYVFGRAFDFDTFEAGGLYGAIISTAYLTLGLRLMLQNWFPLLYLAFAVPPPHVWMTAATSPLKQFVSFAATDLLRLVGYPVGREGVTIFVAQYQLLVEDACSGLNSLIGLTSISLLYVYLRRRSSFAYSALLIAFVLPIAVFVNVIRIMALILLTYYFGNDVAQGFMHMTTGIILFAFALVVVFGLDEALDWTFAKLGRPK